MAYSRNILKATTNVKMMTTTMAYTSASALKNNMIAILISLSKSMDIAIY